MADNIKEQSFWTFESLITQIHPKFILFFGTG